MIDISTALQNILKAVYGKDVRQSIHDAIYQINQNSNEALDLAQIKFGTAVTSPTSPIGGFIEGTIYFNVATGIIWKLSGGSWLQLGTMKSIDSVAKTGTTENVDTYTITYSDGTTSTYEVANGSEGVSIVDVTKGATTGNKTHYDINLSDGTTTPTGFDVENGVSIADISLASTIGNTKNYEINLSDGTKTPTGFSVQDGTSNYVHVRYSANFDGSGMVSVPTDATVYIGIVVTTQSTAPTDPAVYSWVRFIGKSGTGSGDMLKSDFSTKYNNVVDKAAALFDGSNEILATELLDKTTYASKGVAGTVDKAVELVDVTNSKVADTVLLANLTDDGTGLKYKNAPIGGVVDIDDSTIKKNTSGKLEVPIDKSTIVVDSTSNKVKVADSITAKLAKLNADGTLDFDNVDKKPNSLSGYGITNAYTKTEVDGKVGSWTPTVQATATGEQSIIFTGLDLTKAYEIFFDTSDGSQVGMKSSKLTGTTMTYVVDIPTDCPVPVDFKLKITDM